MRIRQSPIRFASTTFVFIVACAATVFGQGTSIRLPQLQFDGDGSVRTPSLVVGGERAVPQPPPYSKPPPTNNSAVDQRPPVAIAPPTATLPRLQMQPDGGIRRSSPMVLPTQPFQLVSQPQSPTPVRVAQQPAIPATNDDVVFEQPINYAEVNQPIFEQYAPRRPGIGVAELDYVTFELDQARPNKILRMRVDSAFGIETPDIVEFMWAKTPGVKGPSNALNLAETGVRYQDIRFMMETGSEFASVVTELPFRVLDPEIHGNTTGLGDMSIAPKIKLLAGHRWFLSQIFRTYLKTGAMTHGLSNGHVSMEPGLLFAFRPNDRFVLNAELKYWFPIAGDPTHSGQILRYGFGVGWVYYDSDYLSATPTFELVAHTIMDGRVTEVGAGGLGVTRELDGETIVNIHPGIMFGMMRNKSIELGISGGITMTETFLYRQMIRADLRFKF